MSSPLDLALEHQAFRTVLADRATRRALLWWRRFDPQQLDLGWELYGQRLVDEAVAAQVEAAKQSNRYMASVAVAVGQNPGPKVVPEAFSGAQLDGREVGPALFGAVTTTKEVTRTAGAARAFEVGASFLATVVGAAIQDMGRQSDMVAAAGKAWTRYVRVLSPGACSRCAVLAGKGSAMVAFKRHPRCRCTAYPIVTTGNAEGKVPDGFFDNPSAYFESLSGAEQDRVFTLAGARAIREGADISAVVNARRGAYGIGYSGHYNIPVKTGPRGSLQPVTVGIKADGTPLRVFATTEGTTVRGQFGRSEVSASGEAIRTGRYRRTTSLRLMPEQIATMAGDDTARFVELLRRYGYLT